MIKNWKVEDLPDGVRLISHSDTAAGGCGFYLSIPILSVAFVAVLDYFGVNVPISWGESTQPDIPVLFFLFATGLAFLGRALYLSYGGEEWLAQPNFLQVHRYLWGYNSKKHFANCHLSLTCYYDGDLKEETPEVDASYLNVVPASGRQFSLLIQGKDSLKQAREFGQILSSKTGWPLSEPDYYPLSST